ncbi:MAG TPA: DUF6359 domain-containing protein [Paludibacter sp.]
MKKTKFFGMMLFALALATTACNNVKEPDPDPVSALPISEIFDTGLGKFTTQSVSGDQVWAFDSHKYVTITGYVATVNNANEDWLISPEIDLTKVTAAKLSFNHVARYFADAKNEATIWVSSNYVTGLPATATWTQLPTKTFTDPGSWPTVLPTSGEISLTAYAGKKIKIAFKYVSTATKAGTWELNNFLVQEGEATVDPTDVVSGDGSEATPYNVAGGIANQGASKWVKGYIVGYASAAASGTVFTFTADTCTQATNILIAGSSTITDPTKCIPVQLPTGAVRTGLNLKDVKANLGKQVTLYGSLELYFSKPGLKNTSYYALEGGTTGGTKPVDTSNAIFTETFASSSQGNFTVENVVLPAGFTSVWLPTATYGMSATGYKVSNFASEGWLISPAINLAGKSNVTLTFEHAIGPAAQLSIDKSFFTVWICNNYVSGNPNNVTWTKIDLTAFSTTAWGYITANLAIPSANLAANAKFAFKYMSTSAASATWEIKNVVVK